MSDLSPTGPDYLARDYESFRRLMLDHLAALAPASAAAGAASLEATLVEALAYIGDGLSYYQDAVATEAYLATARRRTSVRRHARLLDYRLGDGCSARVWVQFEAGADGIDVRAGTAVTTNVDGADPDAARAETFETLHGAVLTRAHNLMTLAEGARLQSRDTAARLAGSLPGLAVGDVLIFEREGAAAHAVRLSRVCAEEASTAIEWHDEDAIPDGTAAGGGWRVLGNVVLAEHGRTLENDLPSLPGGGPAELTIACPALAFAAPYRHDVAIGAPAADAMRPDGGDAEPVLSLVETAPFAPRALRTWTGRRDLLGAGPFERIVAVEPAGGDAVTLRFAPGGGPSGLPGLRCVARYRSGGGRSGNIGPCTLARAVGADPRILAVANPIAACGGADAETLAEARLLAPFQSRIQRRCVTATDYEAMTEAYPGVAEARAELQWEGGAACVAIRVRRDGDRVWTAPFAARLAHYLGAFQLIGHEIAPAGADYVSPELSITVASAPGQPAAAVAAAAEAALAALSFKFGEALDPAQLTERLMQVPGVAAVRIDGASTVVGATIAVSPDAIVRLDHVRVTVRPSLGG